MTVLHCHTVPYYDFCSVVIVLRNEQYSLMRDRNGVGRVRGQLGHRRRPIGRLHPQQPIMQQSTLKLIRMDPIGDGEGALELATNLAARAALLMARHHLQLTVGRFHRDLIRPEARHVKVIMGDAVTRDAVRRDGGRHGGPRDLAEQTAGIVAGLLCGRILVCGIGATRPHHLAHLLVHPRNGAVHVSEDAAHMTAEMLRETGCHGGGRVVMMRAAGEVAIEIAPRGEIPVGRQTVVTTEKRQQRHMVEGG